MKQSKEEPTAVPTGSSVGPSISLKNVGPRGFDWHEAQNSLDEIEQTVAEAASALTEAGSCESAVDFAANIVEARAALYRAIEMLEMIR